MSNTRNVLKNIGLGVLLKPISIIISFVAVPLSISYLGNYNYGIWALILNIVSWISFFDVGIGNGLREHLTRAIANEDFETAKEYIATSYIIVLVISFILLIILGVSVFFLDIKNILNIDEYENIQLSILLFVNIAFVCINFVLKLVTTIFYALQKSALNELMQIFNQVLVLIGIFFLIMLGYPNVILGMSFVYGFSILIVYITFSIILFVKYEMLRFKLTDFKQNKVRILSNLGIKFFVIQIAAMVLFTTDSIIITRLFGPKEITPYNIVSKIFSTFIIFHTIILTPLWSAITKAHSRLEYKWLRETKNNLYFAQIAITIMILCTSLLFHKIIELWLGNLIDVSNTLVASFALYAFLITWSNSFSYFLNGLGKVDIQIKVASFQGIINIPLSIVLARYFRMGVSGVIMATNICLLFSAVIYPLSLKKYLDNLER